MIVTNLSIRNRTTVFVVMIGCIVAGVWCYAALPREAAPDVTIPIVLVNTSYRGVSPEDIETSVTIEIEKKLKSLRNVKEITSTSSEGFSSITIEFDPTIDIDTALQKVRDKVEQAKGELPEDAEIVIFCQTSVRAYQAQRILDGAGFKNVVFMEGSIASWPYEVTGKPAKK